jgi:PAS domain S-box-containing protein
MRQFLSARHPISNYIVAVVASALALLLRLVFDPLLGIDGLPFLFSLCAVVTVGAFNGFGPAVLAMTISVLGISYFLMTPRFSLAVQDNQQLLEMGFFAAAGLFCAFLASRVHRAEQEAKTQTRLAKQQAQRTDAILGSITDGFYTLDPSWSFNFLNPQMCQRLGNNLEGQYIWELYPDAVGTIAYNELHRAMQDRVSLQYEIYYEPWQRWFRDKVYPQAEGGLAVYSQDITDIKNQQIALQASEAQRSQQLAELEAIYLTAPIGLAVFDLQLRVLRLNANLAAINGLPLEDHLGKSLRELVPALADQAEHTLQQVLTTGTTVRTEFRGETRAQPNVEHIWDEQWFPLRDASSQAVVAVCAVVEDITERKKIETELRARTQQLESLLTSAPLGVAFFDRQRRYLRINDALADINGLPVASHLGRALEEVLPDMPPAVAGVIDTVFETGQPLGNFETSGMTPRAPGELRHWLSGFYPVHDAEGHVEMVGAWVVEITERKSAEQALIQSDRRKDEFLATLAHELRNPLAPIRSSLHILRRPNVDADLHARMLAMIDRQVTHLVRLVDDLLEISRITGGKVELRREITDVARVVRSAVEVSGPLVEAAGHGLEVVLPGELVMVDADPVRLAQIVANLLNNAAKYTEAGGQIQVSVTTASDQVSIAVTDTGLGIPAEMLPRVFDLFTQVDRTLGRAQGGLGIGLALVKNLVELHGGTVEAFSKGPGCGSQFVVNLPRMQPISEQSAPESQRELSVSELQGQRILVVDDNRDAAESLVTLLGMLGAQTFMAHDGAAALLAIRSHQPSVVLLDLGMPGMDGYAVAAAIRQEPQWQRLTLIALTGWGQLEDLQRTQEAGFDHHCVKPVDPDALVTLLQRASPAVKASTANVSFARP